MRNWLLSILCLLAMLSSGVAAEARLLVEDADVETVEVQVAESDSESLAATTKSRLDGVRHVRLHHPARAHSGNGHTVALAATAWRWEPRFRSLSSFRGGRATTPFVRSILLSTSSLRAPPRG
jgi:hypothetical protein